VRHILLLAGPIIGGMLSQNLLNLVDTAMVGQLGAAALGAVGFGGMASWLAAAIFMGLGVGVQAISARRVGEGKPKGAIHVLQVALVFVLVLVLPYGVFLADFSHAILDLLSDDLEVIALGDRYLAIRLSVVGLGIANFAFRGYWNGVGQTMVYLRTIMAMHALNIFLNWVLIFGHLGAPEMGVEGAAWASAVSVFVGTLLYSVQTLFSLGPRRLLSLPVEFRKTLRACLRLSVPTGFQSMFFSAGFVAFYALAGLIGTSELAVTSVLINLGLVCILPAVGFGQASMTLVGTALGAGRSEDARGWARLTLGICVSVLTVMGVSLAAGAPVWLSAMIGDPEIAALGVLPLIVLGLSQPIDSVGVVLSNTLIGAGAVRTVMGWSVGLQWGLCLPCVWAWITWMGGGLLGMWVIFVIWRGLFALAMGILFRRGKWLEIAV
jgi:putative MATE family efflux protein